MARHAAARSVIGGLLAAGLALAPLATAGAASPATDRAAIARLEQQIAATGSEIHTLTQAYGRDEVEAATLAQQLQTQKAQLVTLQKQLAGSRTTLQQAALQSYTEGGDSAVSINTSTNPAVGAEYLNVVSQDLTDSMDRYALDQRLVASTISAIRSEQHANHLALLGAATARQRALAAASTDDQHLAVLEADLARAEAQQRTQGLGVGGGVTSLVKSETQPTPAAGSPPASGSTPPSTGSPAPPSTGSPAPPSSGSPPPTTSPPPPSPPPATAPPTTTPPTAPPTTVPSTTTTTTPGSEGGGAGGVWYELRMCESSDNYQADTGNGFYGAYQFLESTWTALGYPGYPNQEPPAMQDQAAMRLQAMYGWGQWPACAAALGLT